jgi:hypothetical protein
VKRRVADRVAVAVGGRRVPAVVQR